MESVVKPTIQELIDAYTLYQKGYNSGTYSQEGWYDLSDSNQSYLENLTQKDYNQETFKILIDSIEYNGLTNFNMTTFIGNIDSWLNESQWASVPISEFTLTSSTSCKAENAFDLTTSAFNCSSVGCIAGFAVANAVKWNQPKWMQEDSRNYLEFFEHVACNWLNIPLQVGRRLFYGDSESVWSFLRFHEPTNYGSIDWLNLDSETDYTTQFWDDYKYDSEIRLETINYKYATDALRRVASGEIIMNYENEQFEPHYSPQYKQNKKAEKANEE